MLKHAPPQEVVDAFHLMWDNFPEPASLVHKSREIVAVNKEHFFPPGVFCSRTGRNGPHKACLAGKALAEGKAVVVPFHSPLEDKELITYWIPLEGHPDYYIHTSVRFRLNDDGKGYALSPIADEAKEAMSFYQDTGEYLFQKQS